MAHFTDALPHPQGAIVRSDLDSALELLNSFLFGVTIALFMGLILVIGVAG